MNGDGTSGEFARDDILSDVDEDLRMRRMSGELLPSYEHRLDDAFASLSPGGDKGAFAAYLDLADRSALVDTEVPVRSNVPGGEVAKTALRKMMWWYLDYVATQLTRFGSATTRLLHILDDRVSRLEQVSAAADAARRLAPPFDPEPWASVVATAVSSAPGPVLHADCGDGALVRALLASDVAAYGVDTRDELLDIAATTGLDVRHEEPLRHLHGLPAGVLGGVVLSGFVDLLAVPTHDRLVEQARAALRPGGVIAVLGTSPDAWARRVPVAVADLSPGRPLHAETWQYLLGEGGFIQVQAHVDPAPAATHLGGGQRDRDTFVVVGVRAP